MGGTRRKSALRKTIEHNRRDSDTLQVLFSPQLIKLAHANQGDSLLLDLGLPVRDQHQPGHPGRQRPPLLDDPHLHRAEHHQAVVDQDEGDGVRVQGRDAQQR